MHRSHHQSDDPARDAKSLLNEYGVATAGDSSADVFGFPLPNGDVVVARNHPGILTYVEGNGSAASAEEHIMGISFCGRDLCTLDALLPSVVHIAPRQ